MLTNYCTMTSDDVREYTICYYIHSVIGYNNYYYYHTSCTLYNIILYEYTSTLGTRLRCKYIVRIWESRFNVNYENEMCTRGRSDFLLPFGLAHTNRCVEYYWLYYWFTVGKITGHLQLQLYIINIIFLLFFNTISTIQVLWKYVITHR